MKTSIVECTIAIILFTALIVTTSNGIKKSELRECQKWQDWTQDYKLFNPTEWQQEQCKQFNINLK